LYVAVIVCEPVVSKDVVTLAVPPLSAVVPKTIAPDLNVTDPVGVPVVEDVTVAVKVTACPTDDGFCDDANAVFVAALFTVCNIADDVLPASFASPL
jgi:hypothetical protein